MKGQSRKRQQLIAEDESQLQNLSKYIDKVKEMKDSLLSQNSIIDELTSKVKNLEEQKQMSKSGIRYSQSNSQNNVNQEKHITQFVERSPSEDQCSIQMRNSKDPESDSFIDRTKIRFQRYKNSHHKDQVKQKSEQVIYEEIRKYPGYVSEDKIKVLSPELNKKSIRNLNYSSIERFIEKGVGERVKVEERKKRGRETKVTKLEEQGSKQENVEAVKERRKQIEKSKEDNEKVRQFQNAKEQNRKMKSELRRETKRRFEAQQDLKNLKLLIRSRFLQQQEQFLKMDRIYQEFEMLVHLHPK